MKIENPEQCIRKIILLHEYMAKQAQVKLIRKHHGNT